MDDVTPSPAAQVSDRMQALLSRAVDEQASEQRAVSTILAELRGQVGELAANLSGIPSAADVARLGGAVSAVVSDLRTATTLLGQRLDLLAERVDQAGKNAAGPTADTTARLSDLASQLAAHGDVVERLATSVTAMSAFPNALSAVQTDVAGLDDWLAPLAGLRADVDDLGARTSTTWESLAPVLSALQSKVDALSGGPDPEVLSNRVVDALTARLDRIETATAAVPRTVALGLDGVREDVAGLAERVTDSTAPTAEEVATIVSDQVADRLVETLAPRIAGVVLSRVGAALVSELAAALSPQVRRDTSDIVHAATTDSERRVVAHVDDAVLALAEALLRRRARAASAASRSEPHTLPEAHVLADGELADTVVNDGADTENARPQEVNEDVQPVAPHRATRRPAVRPRPMLDPTAGCDEGEDLAVPACAAAPRPSPQLPPQPAPPPAKRRPWWRPGG